MSLSLALGIVAVVNLAIGYALALLIESERGDEATNSPTRFSSAETANQQEVTSAAPALPAIDEPMSERDASLQLAPKSPVIAPTNLSASVSDTLESTAIEQPATIQPSSPARETCDLQPIEATPAIPAATATLSAVETIAQCDQLLDTAQKLVAAELSPVENLSLEPRATLADVAQLESAIASWWQNDPQRSRPICAGQIEIDNLRQLTAELGTAVAGSLGQAIERHVLHTLRRDDLVASLGRSRFLVVFPDADGPTAASLIDRLRGRLEGIEFVQADRPLRTTLTGGVAQATVEESVESFLARAAEALAEARTAGRNRVAWHDGTTSQIIQRAAAAPKLERVALVSS